MKKVVLILLLGAIAGWAVWYYLVREKTLGEKIDNAASQTQRAISDAVNKVTK